MPGRERLALLTSELGRDTPPSGSTVLLEHRVKAADFLAGGRHEGVDDVIVATGSRPRRRELPGGLPVFDLWQAVEALDPPVTGSYVVIDEDELGCCFFVAEARPYGRPGGLVSTASVAARITTYSTTRPVRSRFADLRVVAYRPRGPSAPQVRPLWS